MRFTHRAFRAESLVCEIARLLPEYAPGIDTGAAAYTDSRTCWTRTMRCVLQVIARSRGIEMREPLAGEPDSEHQLKALWYEGDGLLLAVRSGWGERADLERSFGNLLLLKSPQKVLVYTCMKWQEAVMDQLTAALLRYPHHIEGEQYIAVNLLPQQSKVQGMICEMTHSGSIGLAEATFRPIPGSPFCWRPPEPRKAEAGF